MDVFPYFLFAGFILTVLAVLVTVVYAVLEEKWREKQAKLYARKIIMKRIELEKEIEERNKRITQSDAFHG